MTEFHSSASVPDWNLPLFHETQLTDRYKQFRGKYFFDVGAHVGTWSLRLASNFEKVFAFEPNPYAREVLKDNLSSYANVEIIDKAVLDYNGKTTLTLYRGPAQTTIHKVHPLPETAGEKTGEIVVDCISLDFFCKERGIDVSLPTLVKVDTEGAEVHVVKGGLSLFLSPSCRFCIEYHDVKYGEEIRNILSGVEDLNYGRWGYLLR
jgi:FkbM family methyltransferase